MDLSIQIKWQRWARILGWRRRVWILHCILLITSCFMRSFRFSFELCTAKFRLREFGVYDLVLSSDGTACEVTEALESVNAFLAILYWSLIVIGLVVIYKVFMYFNDKGSYDKAKKAWRNQKRKMGFKVSNSFLKFDEKAY